MTTRGDIANESNRKLYQNHLASMAKLREARLTIENLEHVRNHTQRELVHVVALLSRLYPSGTKPTELEFLPEDGRGCVYIDLPTGQASFHYHDRYAHLFADLPAYEGVWDGHSNEDKYERLIACAALEGRDE